MSAHDRRIGGASVGQLSQLDDLEACAVVYLRLWSDGAEGQTAVWNDLATGLGPTRGRTALAAFEDLIGVIAHHGRRPLMRHAVHCACLGADEACFARFIATATLGEREDALLMAMLLVRPDFAPHVTSVAQDFGLAIKQMLLRRPTCPVTHRPAEARLH